MLNPTNINIMESSGTSIYLKAGLETIWERIKEDKGRPLLEVENPYETAGDLLESRKVLYESSNIVVETETVKIFCQRTIVVFDTGY